MNLPIRLMRTETITVTRATADVTYVNGLAQDRPTEEIVMSASVQPADADIIAQFPEGDRGTSTIIVFTSVQMLKRDRFTWHGTSYTVLQEGDWNTPTLHAQHFECIATSENFTK